MQKNYTIEKVQSSKPLCNRSDNDLKQIAHDIYTDKIFTDRHIAQKDKQDVGMVFLALGLMDMVQKKSMLKQKPGMLFEYSSKAGPRGINGYPCFFGFHIVSVHDSKKIDKYYSEIDSKLSQYNSKALETL